MSIIKDFCLKGMLLNKIKIKFLLQNNILNVSFPSSYLKIFPKKKIFFPEVAKVLESINQQNNSDSHILDHMQKPHLIYLANIAQS